MLTVCTPAASNAARSFRISPGSVEGKCSDKRLNTAHVKLRPNKTSEGCQVHSRLGGIAIVVCRRDQNASKRICCNRDSCARVRGKVCVRRVHLFREHRVAEQSMAPLQNVLRVNEIMRLPLREDDWPMLLSIPGYLIVSIVDEFESLEW